MMLLAYDSCRSLLAPLLKPAYADNKIRAWGDSLATWPKKRRLFICCRSTWPGKGVQGGEWVCGQRFQRCPSVTAPGASINPTRAPALIAAQKTQERWHLSSRMLRNGHAAPNAHNWCPETEGSVCKPSLYVFIHNRLLSNLHTFLLHQWPHPSKPINALLNCGRIKGLTPPLPNVHTALKEPATNSDLCCSLRL